MLIKAKLHNMLYQTSTVLILATFLAEMVTETKETLIHISIGEIIALLGIIATSILGIIVLLWKIKTDESKKITEAERRLTQIEDRIESNTRRMDEIVEKFDKMKSLVIDWFKLQVKQTGDKNKDGN